jgi:hypothetical protein
MEHRFDSSESEEETEKEDEGGQAKKKRGNHGVWEKRTEMRDIMVKSHGRTGLKSYGASNAEELDKYHNMVRLQQGHIKVC